IAITSSNSGGPHGTRSPRWHRSIRIRRPVAWRSSAWRKWPPRSTEWRKRMSIEEQLAGGEVRETPAKRDRLRINEIFHSLQGEADAVGFRTVFVRLTGCPLRCQYCDTEYAFHAGEWRDTEDILARVASFDTPYVCVTGGEPLAQPNCLALLCRLCDAGHEVSLETSGALDIAGVDSRVKRGVD